MFDGFKIMRKDQARRLKYQEAQKIRGGSTSSKVLTPKQSEGQIKSFVSKLVK